MVYIILNKKKNPRKRKRNLMLQIGNFIPQDKNKKIM
jgi:hypothetical protein